MMNYYLRQIELWGESTQDSLNSKKIAIIGSGGLGCSIGIALSGSGISNITLVDFDKVSLHNVHRQIAFSSEDVDKYKADVLSKIISHRNPYIECHAITSNFEEFSKLDKDFDLIIDATDNLNTRVEIDTYSKSKNTPWIYGSVEAFMGQVCFFDKANFSDTFKITNHKPAGIAAPMVMQIASFQANIAIRYLTNQTILKDKLYYLSFDKDGDFVIQKFGLGI